MKHISKKRMEELTVIATATLSFWEGNELTPDETMYVVRALYCSVLYQRFTSRGYDLNSDVSRNFALSMERAAICDGLDKMCEDDN